VARRSPPWQAGPPNRRGQGREDEHQSHRIPIRRRAIRTLNATEQPQAETRWVRFADHAVIRASASSDRARLRSCAERYRAMRSSASPSRNAAALPVSASRLAAASPSSLTAALCSAVSGAPDASISCNSAMSEGTGLVVASRSEARSTACRYEGSLSSAASARSARLSAHAARAACCASSRANTLGRSPPPRAQIESAAGKGTIRPVGPLLDRTGTSRHDLTFRDR
jgi:hypothetical protein